MKELYYENQYISEFDAVVTACEETEDGLFAVTLDETAFFPEQGGQYADEGKINGIEVLNVQKTGGDVVHFLKEPLAVGCEVTGIIDFEKRFDRMQQHSGEHVISGVLHNFYGLENVGFHLSDEEMTMDTSGELGDEEIRTVERIANEIVFKNLQVTVSCPTPEEAEKIQFRSKKEILNGLRLVSIGDFDTCACCAPHVSLTGEIGLIKILKSMRWKGGMRLFVACGRRALLDYDTKLSQIRHISQITNTKPENVVGTVSDMYDKLSEARSSIKKYQLKIAENIMDERLCTLNSSEAKLVCANLEGDIETLREAVNFALSKAPEATVFVFGGSDENGYTFVLGKADGDVQPLGKEIIASLSGRGGGRGNMMTGTIRAKKAEIEGFFDAK